MPAQDLEVALRLDSACMQDVQDSQEQWAEERGAIEQEVARDLSNPTYKFVTRLNEDLFSGTPYAHDALGTKASFDATTGAMLKKYYQDWYAPNNAILVITGDVDPAATLAKVKQLYGPIPRRPIPVAPRRSICRPSRLKASPSTAICPMNWFSGVPHARNVQSRFCRHSYSRRCGRAASAPISTVWCPQGKALAAEFGHGRDLSESQRWLCGGGYPGRSRSGADYRPDEGHSGRLCRQRRASGAGRGAKKSEIASAEFQQNSIPELAATWSQAVAGEGRKSPADIVEAMKKVTVADVNRAAKTYLTVQNADSGDSEAVGLRRGGSRQRIRRSGSNYGRAYQAGCLPDWAETAVKSLKVPQATGASGRPDMTERPPADCPDRESQPDRYGDRRHQARAGSADPAG